LDLNAELKGTATLAPRSLASLIPVAVQVMHAEYRVAGGRRVDAAQLLEFRTLKSRL
jgi:hypothetical protein